LATAAREVEVVNKLGLHARPAIGLVEIANRFTCRIELSNGALVVDAKSIMSVLRLAAEKGIVLRIVADGEDAAEAAEAMAAFVASGFAGDDQAEAALASEETDEPPERGRMQIK
jgi:phosphocarrier protein